MSTGSLLFPVGHVFRDDNDTPVNGGLVYFFRTGTTTEQDTYSDSTLDTANANPVELNSNGRSTTLIYGDPTVFDYRVRLCTSADVQIWQYDDVVVDGADTVTTSSGSFTGTITGTNSATTGTVSYRVLANSAGTGKICVLYAEASISGTSNTTAMTMTGLPAACTPTVAVRVATVVTDNSTSILAGAQISAAGTTITFSCDTPLDGAGFTAANLKGVAAGWTISYPL